MALVAAGRTTSAIRGDAADAGRLFEEHSARIFGYCLGRLGSRVEAEDAVQTTFLYAHRALQRGVVPESEPAWLTVIAKNVCRSQQRTILRRGCLSSDLELDSLAGQQEVGGEDSELLFGLEEALASMPEKQRRALVLREWHGMSAPEVASEMGLSPPATHALLTRARRTLANALTTLPRRPVLGLDLGSLLVQLRALFAGTAAKVVASTVVVVGVTVAGVPAERALGDARSTSSAPAAALRTEGNARTRGVGRSAHAMSPASSVSAALGRQRRVKTADHPYAPTTGGTTGGAAPDEPVTPTVEGGRAPEAAGGNDGAVTDPGGELLPGVSVSLEPLPLPGVGLPDVGLPPELPLPDPTLPLPSAPQPPDDGPPPTPPPLPAVELP